MTARPGALRKLMQDHYWGSDLWEAEYAKRTYVEGSYGNRKNASTEDLRRGYQRLHGIAMVHIAVVLTAVAYNLRMHRNWHERTGRGDPNDPLLAKHDQEVGWRYLTPDEAAEVATDADADGYERNA